MQSAIHMSCCAKPHRPQPKPWPILQPPSSLITGYAAENSAGGHIPNTKGLEPAFLLRRSQAPTRLQI